jgi:hypothetical protein
MAGVSFILFYVSGIKNIDLAVQILTRSAALIHGLKIGIDMWYCYPIKGGIWMFLNLLMESLFII